MSLKAQQPTPTKMFFIHSKYHTKQTFYYTLHQSLQNQQIPSWRLMSMMQAFMTERYSRLYFKILHQTRPRINFIHCITNNTTQCTCNVKIITQSGYQYSQTLFSHGCVASIHLLLDFRENTWNEHRICNGLHRGQLTHAIVDICRHIHQLNCFFSETTWPSRYQKS